MSDLAERDAKIVARFRQGGVKHAEVAAEFGVPVAVSRNAVKLANRMEQRGALVVVAPAGGLAAYDRMVLAIAEAKSFDEAKELRDEAEALRVYAHQAKNRQAELDCAEIRIRAERRAGEIIKAAKSAGHIARGQPKKNSSEAEHFSPVKLADVGIDRKASMEWQKLASIKPDDFEWEVSRWRQAADKEGARVTVKLLKGEAGRDKATARAVKEELLGRQIAALPDRKFGVILADPEWRFEPWSRKTGMDRAADNHYPTSATEVIASRPVEAIAADRCVLFLWATAPMLPAALAVMEAWGFDYRSHFIWAKDRIGTGYWNRNRHELLLLGIKGDVPAPAMGTQFESVIEAAVGKHSAKPERFLEMIETYFPTLPKIELNRRGPARPGWEAWGNEVEESQAKAEEAVRPDEAQAQGMLPRGEEGSASDLTDDAASRLSAGRTADATEVEDRDGSERRAPLSRKIDFDIPEFLRRQSEAA